MHKIFTHTLFIGKQVVYLPACRSTNDTAAELITHSRAFEGAIVITDEQTAGKGQRGNTWEAETAKNLTFSVVLRPAFLEVRQQFRLTVAVALAVSDALQDFLPNGIKVKWPNDIYYYDNKLGGILIENTIKKNQIDHAVVGIGLNINQKTFTNSNATSLALAAGQEFDRREVLSHFLTKLEARYLQLKKGHWNSLLSDYYSRLLWLNETHTFLASEEFKGEIVGVDETGQLLIKAGQSIRSFGLKEVRFLS